MSWLNKISNAITSAIGGVRKPAPTVPPLLLLCEINNRPGLSAISLTTSIISRLPEIGIPTGPNPDGSANMVNLFVKVISEELIKEIQTNGVVMCAIEPNGAKISGTGTAPGLPPITVEGFTGEFGMKGIVQ